MNDRPPSLDTLFDGLLAKYPVRGDLELCFDGYAVNVASNSPELIGELGRYYRMFRAAGAADATLIYALEGPVPVLPFPFAIEPAGPGKKIKHEYWEFPDGRVVRKRETGMHFLFNAERHMAVGACGGNLNQVINFINTRYMSRLLHRGAVLCHASGMAVDGRGLAIAGASGVGKSTLALHLVAQGASFVSNDRVLVEFKDGALMMRGVPKFPRVNPGTILNNSRLRGVLSDGERERLSALPTEGLWDLEDKYDVRIDELFGEDRFVLSTPIKALVLLKWKKTPEAIRLEPVEALDQAKELSAILKTPGVFHYSRRDEVEEPMPLDQLTTWLRGCPVVRISGGGSFQPAIEACREFLALRSLAETVGED